MVRGRYVGIRARLRGETALLMEGPGVYLAQFDDLRHKESHGWHPFPRSDFTLETVPDEVYDDPTRPDRIRDIDPVPTPADAPGSAPLRDVRDDQRPGGAGRGAEPGDVPQEPPRSELRDHSLFRPEGPLPSGRWPLKNQSGWYP